MRSLLGSNGYIHYLDCGDSFLYMIVYFRYVGYITGQLYLNETIIYNFTREKRSSWTLGSEQVLNLPLADISS